MDSKVEVRCQERRSSVTIRELQILGFMARGNSSKEIADDLYISEHTVISHRQSLLRKLGARNTAHLIFKGVQQGFIM